MLQKNGGKKKIKIAPIGMMTSLIMSFFFLKIMQKMAKMFFS